MYWFRESPTLTSNRTFDTECLFYFVFGTKIKHVPTLRVIAHSVLPRHAVDVGVRTARFDINTLFFKCH